ncbi:hypothetical protein [Streptomyces sp. cmx-4-9]|uniref:hypothetical protein n=1 Tax=Streptomyces sp. cmx-4-9 TaxID=2790941 RepID=UPI00397FC59A
MEELAYVATKIVKGVAGLAYAFGDTLTALGGPDAADAQRRKKPEGGTAEDHGRDEAQRPDGPDGAGGADGAGEAPEADRKH